MAAPSGGVSEFAADVRAGLARPGQKELPSRYLYDDLGSALFEAITLLPEYGLTRADERIIERYAPEIARRFQGPVRVAELGSGVGKKTRPLLRALARSREVAYYPIDVSPLALERCRWEAERLGRIRVTPIERDYLGGLLDATSRRRVGDRLLVLFLGSTIGNFERPAAEAFLRSVRALLRPGDALLVGADLVKPAALLLPAYDDPTGVTAAFNRNLLGRMNRELGADFDLDAFEHQARWDDGRRRIEMHLVSRAAQNVSVPGACLSVCFEAGESIWTESCHKFQAGELDEMACACGFRPEAQWTDEEWPFAECLWLAERTASGMHPGCGADS